MNYEYCDGVTHTIKKGDTLYEISRKYNVALALLLRANPYVDVFNLQVGDTICIPAGSQMTPYPLAGGVRDNRDRDDRDDRDDFDNRDDRDDMDDRDDRDNRDDMDDRDGRDARDMTGNMNNRQGNLDSMTGNMNNRQGNLDSMTGNINDRQGNLDSMTGNMNNRQGNLDSMMGNMGNRQDNRDSMMGNMGNCQDNRDNRMENALNDILEERYQAPEPDRAGGNTSASCWEKYVIQPGDTLEDVLREMNGDAVAFLERNRPANIYMLPGVAYYICKNK